jgi:peroxin-11B
LRYLAVGRQLGYAGYLSLDILTYVFPSIEPIIDVQVHAAGIKSFSHISRIQKLASQLWLVGLLCNIAAGTYTLKILDSNAKSSTIEKTAEEKKRNER